VEHGDRRPKLLAADQWTVMEILGNDVKSRDSFKMNSIEGGKRQVVLNGGGGNKNIGKADHGISFCGRTQ